MKRYLAKKKAQRLKWSRNANAAKERKRMERPPPDPEPKFQRAPLPWEITVRNAIDGQSATFRPRSGRHAKRILDLMFSEYQPGRPIKEKRL
jgi:hypothetical protein